MKLYSFVEKIVTMCRVLKIWGLMFIPRSYLTPYPQPVPLPPPPSQKKILLDLSSLSKLLTRELKIRFVEVIHS